MSFFLTAPSLITPGIKIYTRVDCKLTIVNSKYAIDSRLCHPTSFGQSRTHTIPAAGLLSFRIERDMVFAVSKTFVKLSHRLSSSAKKTVGKGLHTHARRRPLLNSLSTYLVGGCSLIALASYWELYNKAVYLDSVRGYADKQSDHIMLSDQEVDNRLRQFQESNIVSRNNGIVRFDVAQLPSNSPIEDTHVEATLNVPLEENSLDLCYFGIFDGHSGPYTSRRLRSDLVQYVTQELYNAYQLDNKLFQLPGTDEIFNNAITTAFLKLDNEIVWKSLEKLYKNPTKENFQASLPAISGSCALLGVYNSADRKLRVALSGDSRALLGKLDESGNWSVESLSTDQTGDNIDEVERIRKEHPNEPNVIRNGRILGSLQPSRAFGDYRYKVKEIDGKSSQDLPNYMKLQLRREPKSFFTPPYVTAKPEITTTIIDKDTKFLIMASDGLFELLNNEEIGGLVIKWMDKYLKRPSISNTKELPNVKDISKDQEFLRSAFRYRQRDAKESDASNYFLEDENAATHIIRNALSASGSREFLSAILSIPSPKSRNFRDDLTVTVVFFDERVCNEPLNTIPIKVNEAATTPLRSKL